LSSSNKERDLHIDAVEGNVLIRRFKFLFVNIFAAAADIGIGTMDSSFLLLLLAEKLEIGLEIGTKPILGPKRSRCQINCFIDRI